MYNTSHDEYFSLSANVSKGRSSLCLSEFSNLLPRLALAFDDGGQLARKEEFEGARAGSTVVDLSTRSTFAVIREGSAGAETRQILRAAGLQERK